MERSLRWAIAAIAAGVLTSIGLFWASIARAAPPTVNLTANPLSGFSPLNTTVSWSTTGAVSCSASGAWSGSKALNGSQTFTGLIADKTYNLTCVAADGSVTFSWVAPTLNEDGTPLTDLASYRLSYAGACADISTGTTVSVAAPATSLQLTGLAPGPLCGAVKAVNTAGAESVFSNTASKTVAGGSTTRSVTVDVQTRPAPPTTLTIAMEVFDLKVTGPRYALNKNIGSIALGVECGALRVSNNKGNYYEVPIDLVTFTGAPQSAVVVAKCGAVS